jgi:hypothetical protein
MNGPNYVLGPENRDINKQNPRLNILLGGPVRLVDDYFLSKNEIASSKMVQAKLNNLEEGLIIHTGWWKKDEE